MNSALIKVEMFPNHFSNEEIRPAISSFAVFADRFGGTTARCFFGEHDLFHGPRLPVDVGSACLFIAPESFGGDLPA